MGTTRNRHGAGGVLSVAWIAAALVAGGLFTACSQGGGHPMGPGEMNERGYMAHPATEAMAGTTVPDYAMRSEELQLAYSFALAHPEVLTYMPCSCGCSGMGHLSNWNCYVKDVSADGVVTFDPHASGCRVCLDITRDVAGMWQLGSPLSEIRSYVDATYPGIMDTEQPPGAV